MLKCKKNSVLEKSTYNNVINGSEQHASQISNDTLLLLLFTTFSLTTFINNDMSLDIFKKFRQGASKSLLCCMVIIIRVNAGLLRGPSIKVISISGNDLSQQKIGCIEIRFVPLPGNV